MNKPKIRCCLKCGEEFNSWGAANRICNHCKLEIKYINSLGQGDYYMIHGDYIYHGY